MHHVIDKTVEYKDTVISNITGLCCNECIIYDKFLGYVSKLMYKRKHY